MSNLFADFPQPEPSRVIGWFSCGVTSAVACKLLIADRPTCEIVRIVLAGEHEDNERFHDDCERWYGREIKRLYPPRYKDHFEVAEQRRYINGPQGALCTAELKRATREAYQRGGDLHVFGFDADEVDRAAEYEERMGLWLETPLITAGLTKMDCKAIVERADIQLPAMYRLGYQNNNCIGCWKGGMGYWNRIRKDFPEVFERAAAIGKSIGRSPVKEQDGTPIMLHELDPSRGRFEADQPVSCGPLCELTVRKISGAE